MTREEAIYILKCVMPNSNMGCGESDEEIEEALMMAVEALEQQPYENFESTNNGFDKSESEEYVPDINVGNINCILNKIRHEIESCREDEEPHLVDYRYYRNEGLDMALDIIDKYKAESEEEDGD